MPLIEGFRVQNYRALKDVRLGRLWSDQKLEPLTPLVVVIGKNGSGKSTLFDAFGFLADCLRVGVEEACDVNQRGGFERLRSAGSTEPIRFEIYYREGKQERPITYELTINLDAGGRPQIREERLRQRRKGQKHGRPFSFLQLELGEGLAWSGDEGLEGEEASQVQVKLADSRRLAISTLGSLREHPRITRFRQFLEGWHLSYFTPDAARSLPMAGPQRHLNLHGDNLANVVQFLEREHRDRFKAILKKIASKIPGIQDIKTERSNDGRLLLCFNDRGFVDPFFVQQMSDGTLKLFAYLLLLQDPEPPPFLCIEEPENGLYPKLLDALAREFREAATAGRTQVFVTTHQPHLVDATNPVEVWILEKAEDGFATVRRASDDPVVKCLVDEGLPLGSLWFSDYLEKPNAF